MSCCKCCCRDLPGMWGRRCRHCPDCNWVIEHCHCWCKCGHYKLECTCPSEPTTPPSSCEWDLRTKCLDCKKWYDRAYGCKHRLCDDCVKHYKAIACPFTPPNRNYKAEPERVSDESLQSFLDTITVPGVAYNREYVDKLIRLLQELQSRRAAG